MPLRELLERYALDAPALLFENRVYTRRQLLEQVRQVAGTLNEAGVSRGSKVVLALPNAPALIVSLLAANECGAVVMPLNPSMSAEDRQRIEHFAQPDFTIGADGDLEVLPNMYLSRAQQRRLDACPPGVA